MVTYCQRCILPDTRPGIEIATDGVCSACRSHVRTREQADWDQRSAQFDQLVAETKALERPYDCVIPVSGGKDSTWQAALCLERSLRPLAVTWKTPARTELGRRNLENLIELGVDHIDFSVNPKVERRFTLAALERFGTTALPMHMAIFNVPITIAVRYEVPLVVWGENSAAEYAGTGPEADSFRLDRAWFEKYGVTHGTVAADWVSGELTAADLTPYAGPSPEEVTERGIEAVFLGHFFRWDPEETASFAAERGFESRQAGPAVGYYDYADIDDAFLISIHHWIKWLKFGITRTWDNLSLEIRNGRLTRDQAIEILAERGDETPHADIEAFCEWVGIELERFWEIVERFRDPDVWSEVDGVWRIDGFLLDDWRWG